MKKVYSQLLKRIWLVLFWSGLFVSQLGWAQSIPAVQWTQPGKTLTVLSVDRTIATSDSLPQAVKYNPQGNKIWQSGLLAGTSFIGGKVPIGCNCSVNGFAPLSEILLTTPSPDGGLVLVGREFSSLNFLITKLDVNGRQGIIGRVNMAAFDQNPDPVATSTVIFDDLLTTPDGGYLLLVTSIEPTGKTVAFVQKFSSTLDLSWLTQLAYPTPNPASPDRSLTKGKSIINTPDGGYLVAGYFNTTGNLIDQITSNLTDNTGWVAKLDGQGGISWQKLLTGLSVTLNINGPVPGSIIKMLSATDVIPSADGSGYAIVGAGLAPGSLATPPPTTAILEIDPSGSPKRARSIDANPTAASIALYPVGNTNYYAVGNTSLANGADPQILKVSTATVSLSDPSLFSVIAKRTIDSDADVFLKSIAVAGDGGLVFLGSNDQINKLLSETPPPSLTLNAPIYNCQTGAIVFNTRGGDGSPITFTAPGITRASVTDAFGTVEPGLRNDPKVIVITATQAGTSVTYSFDLKSGCTTPSTPQPPALLRPIPDLFFTVGQSAPSSGIPIGSYFSDPNVTLPNYRPGWAFIVTGLPPGFSLFYRSQDLLDLFQPAVLLFGSSNVPGVYTVTVTASTEAFRSTPIFTTFKITISTTPAGGLTLIQPTYNCQTGAITFNTTGGDGSPITFIAPGITRASATSPVGIVEPELRKDPKPITIQAIQGNQISSFTFDFAAYCNTPQPPNPPVGGPLTLLAPTYNCATGAIHFNTSGGDGSPIEYQSPGITGWTTNPDQFVDKDSRMANDVKPFTLMARQNGQVVTYIWDLKAACGRARTGVPELATALQVQVLGNPLTGETVDLSISGVRNQSVNINLVDQQGRVLTQQAIGQAGDEDRLSLPVNNSRGLLFLQVSTATERQQTKLLKP